MPLDQGALIVADIGTLLTRVFLVDIVNNFYRVIARAEVLSTIDPPYADCTQALIEGMQQIEQLTGRSLVRDHQPITPYQPDGSGIDGLVVASSAAGNLPVVIAAIAGDSSGASARRAIRSTYTTLLKMITLDDQAQAVGIAETSWIDRQVRALMGLNPRVVVIAGGVEGGATSSLVRLAQMLALTVLAPRPGTAPIPVLFAGNSAAQDAVGEALANIVPVTAVTNVRPKLEREDLVPLRREMVRIYNEQVLPKLPGLEKIRAWTTAQPRNTAEGYSIMTRFLGRYHQRRVLLVDVGAAASACYFADADGVSPAILGDNGIIYGGMTLLSRVGHASIARWLPFEANEATITNRILNQLLRPQVLPSSREDLLFAQALAREAMREAMEALQEELPVLDYDLILASGGALTHVAHPAQAALMILDGLQPGALGRIATDIYLDMLGLLPACGALAAYNADAAFCLLEQDILRSGPLATVIATVGDGEEGKPAVEVELTPVGGMPQTLTVMHGEIRRIPLPRGRRGTLRAKPVAGIRIGGNEPGAEVQTDEAAIGG